MTTALLSSRPQHESQVGQELSRALVEPLAGASRRENRARHMAVVDELVTSIEWSALDDELGYD